MVFITHSVRDPPEVDLQTLSYLHFCFSVQEVGVFNFYLILILNFLNFLEVHGKFTDRVEDHSKDERTSTI